MSLWILLCIQLWLKVQKTAQSLVLMISHKRVCVWDESWIHSGHPCSHLPPPPQDKERFSSFGPFRLHLLLALEWGTNPAQGTLRWRCRWSIQVCRVFLIPLRPQPGRQPRANTCLELSCGAFSVGRWFFSRRHDLTYMTDLGKNLLSKGGFLPDLVLGQNSGHLFQLTPTAESRINGHWKGEGNEFNQSCIFSFFFSFF